MIPKFSHEHTQKQNKNKKQNKIKQNKIRKQKTLFRQSSLHAQGRVFETTQWPFSTKCFTSLSFASFVLFSAWEHFVWGSTTRSCSFCLTITCHAAKTHSGLKLSPIPSVSSPSVRWLGNGQRVGWLLGRMVGGSVRCLATQLITGHFLSGLRASESGLVLVRDQLPSWTRDRERIARAQRVGNMQTHVI